MEEGSSTNEEASAPTGIVVSGDPLGSRILALLLRDSGYQAKFLPTSSFNEPGALQGIRLVLLTPMHELSNEDSKVLSTSLKEMQQTTELIVMELTTLSEERRVEEVQDLPLHKVPWPCRFEELQRRIEAALRQPR